MNINVLPDIQLPVTFYEKRNDGLPRKVLEK